MCLLGVFYIRAITLYGKVLLLPMVKYIFINKCGIRNYFCESCIALLHSNKCVFHVVEQWKVSIYNL